ncbi:alpha-glucosidase [Paucilactobacillus oligofermentans DSM 15707 = LMG 22743]|uniref:Alpha-glucosidase n=1 Tax=Paucilactobacillus oligofermentans DSM 15707 = LMG 22743 TaxID=1423778 RepID=A0A0R1RF81_9LACO|nr:alpha,alpha-phosphotrehalase [Paucilactobacillus oligofermentans]KRL55728.1 alpha-glucosidase [Paucilactobacillus oligofermentans DSM 15707 = LMG 22743]CUS27052.1 Oligo-1,6-glucosidase [Paucilactobacillus oligofermentans DSM 15707 = LMG 22743]
MTTNNWWQKSIVYQIYPKSFQDSNNDGIGDLRGIINRLDYIKELGVDIIWLNPIYRSPNVDNGYDISDYQAIQPDFGSMADFQELLDKIHQKNMKIMMDLVVNHSSDEHEWFKASRQGKNNSKRDFYIWRDPVDGHEPTNWGSYFSGSTWTLDKTSGQYYLHLFAKEQPDLNWESPQMRHSVYDMMNWWADKGVDGFRMDVINLISKPAKFQDGSVDLGETYADVEPIVSNGHKIHQYLQEMNKNVMKHHNLVTVGETPAASPDDAKKYANLDSTELNMVFQFEHMSLDANKNPALGKWGDRRTTLSELRANLTKWQLALTNKAWNSLYWNNHDQPRVVSRFGNDCPEYRVVSAKMLATMLHFMQGTPYIYQGEELGMTNANFDNLTDYKDLETLNIYQQLVNDEQLVSSTTMMNYIKLHSRDNARTPMQWDNSTNAGFSQQQPWLAVNPNYPEINVKTELADENSVFHYYQKLIKLRHTMPVITDGRYQLIDGNELDEDVFTYIRENADTKLVIILNFTNQTITRNYQLPIKKTLLISNYTEDLGSTLRPYEAKVYKI